MRYLGEPVALVAAETEEAARGGRPAVAVEYETFPGVFDPEAAWRPGRRSSCPTRATSSRAGRSARATSRPASATPRSSWRASTARSSSTTASSSPRPAWRGSTRTASSPSGWRPRSSSTSATWPRCCGVPHTRVRVIAHLHRRRLRRQGGRHGRGVPRPAGLEDHAAGAMVWTRAGVDPRRRTKRHPFLHALPHGGAPATGRDRRVSVELISDAGRLRVPVAPDLLYAMVHAAGPYRIPHVKVDGVSVLHEQPADLAPSAGFGAAQPAFAYESQMDARGPRARAGPPRASAR